MSRPLSPHIFIYKPQISSLFSVFHRATGILLSLGLLFFVFFIELFSYNLSFYSIYSLAFYLDSFFAWFVISCFIILLFSLFYHAFNGIRHLFWDFYSEKTLNIKAIQYSAFIILFITFFSGLFFLFLLQ